MRFTTRIAIFIALVAAVADAPALLGQRQAGPNTARPQTAEDAPGRGRAGGQQGARDAERGRAQLRTGTASIRGRVVNATSGVPVRRASIRADSVNDRGESQGRSATTDDNGGFELRDLQAGRWTLRAAKTGYVEQQFGQRSALATVDPVTLAEGQQFVADFRLMRGGAISGHILDEFGDPVAGANVSAMRLQATAQGQRTTRTGTSVPSDDTGAYRIYGLPPGQYYVSVTDPSAARMFVFSPDGSDSVRFEAAVSVRVDAEHVMFIGNEATTRTSYAPTYYPGTANIADAQRLTLGLGEDRSGITLTIVPTRTARITGRVMGANGAPSRATVSLVGALNQSFSPSGGRNGASTDGAFTLTNVPPGNYMLNVLGPNVGAAPPEVASMPLVVNGEDIPGLTVVTGSGANIQGSILAESGGRLPASRIRVTASPVQNNSATWTPRAEVNENGTFALEGMLGIYTLRFESLPSGWIVKSITANGIDVSDAAIELRPADRVSVRVELTDRITQVSGTVRPTRDVRGGTVVVFADEPSKWSSSSRFVKTARVGDDGRFTISGLPPHQRYLAVAVDYVESGEAQSPEFLQRAKAAASNSFGLVAGGQQVLDLSLVVR